MTPPDPTEEDAPRPVVPAMRRLLLIAAGLVLFALTLVVNAGARYFVVRAERKSGARVAATGAGA